ncbi:MAG: nitronate monooxygenase [Verrucomicrobia bacterium]|nr:nitronate monooxygenase [Verrucomicrobiota bacterium]
MSHPIIIQGGMGVAVSGWPLARAVSQEGQLGVVSGTLLSVVFARRLQQGDPGGHLQRALAHFPLREMAERVRKTWFVAGGKPAGQPFKTVPMPALDSPPALIELTVVANFAEVFLAKEGHAGVIGLNLLEKIQLPTLPSLFGAMLAGVDYVLMGAGIPRAIPGVLDQFARGEPAELALDVAGAAAPARMTFDPGAFCKGAAPVLKRPRFLAIVSSATLATTLARKSTGRVDGFVVEGELAGGHNASPRGPLQLNAAGEPVYGPRDVPDLEKIRELGLPFWIAGAQATPTALARARRLGAAGVQVGTAFAFCEESGITPALKGRALALSLAGRAAVYTDPLASPTGFPFKILQLTSTLSNPARYAGRTRVCDLGYLRKAYTKPDGTLGYRCAGEPVENFVRKGGARADTLGRKCLCNGLLATVGLGQLQDGHPETALVTAGNDVAALPRYLGDCRTYSAADVIRSLLQPDFIAPDLEATVLAQT